MSDRRQEQVILMVVRYIGSASLIYALAVALCALLRYPVPEGLTALASGAGGYLAGLLTPRPQPHPVPSGTASFSEPPLSAPPLSAPPLSAPPLSDPRQ